MSVACAVPESVLRAADRKDETIQLGSRTHQSC